MIIKKGGILREGLPSCILNVRFKLYGEKGTTCMSQASHIHLRCFRRLDHPQRSYGYLFLLLFNIEDNVQFKFGRVNSILFFSKI